MKYWAFCVKKKCITACINAAVAFIFHLSCNKIRLWFKLIRFIFPNVWISLCLCYDIDCLEHILHKDVHLWSFCIRYTSLYNNTISNGLKPCFSTFQLNFPRFDFSMLVSYVFLRHLFNMYMYLFIFEKRKISAFGTQIRWYIINAK